MHLLEVALGFQIYGSGGGGRGNFVLRADSRQMAKFLFHQIQHLLMSDIARGSDQDFVGSKPIAKAAAQSFFVKIADCLRCAEDRTAEGMFRPEAARENGVEQVLRIVQVHLDFFEDYLTLFLYVFGIE